MMQDDTIDPPPMKSAAILPGDATDAPRNRDIIIQPHDNSLHRVSALRQAYFPLCYSLLFLRGENGYHLGLTRNMMDFFAYRLQYRIGDSSFVHASIKVPFTAIDSRYVLHHGYESPQLFTLE
ncbi:MAG: hypothetical protein J3R72DRAFT_437684 [Linnemannia gamsii]|nr:MAG: hypothetical protein J3R72DRAFT_437684 [Linnemannia gamsii]